MRKPGWYWAKVIKDGPWGCFEWNGHAWWEGAREYPESLFDVVGPRIPTPDEPWQCMPVDPPSELMQLMPEVLASLKGSGVDVSLADDVERALKAAPKPESYTRQDKTRGGRES